jgi:accessory gene regulator B
MIELLSNNITDFFYSNNIIEENEKEIISYGLQLIISSIIGISLIFSFGIILNKVVETMIFIVTFIAIRMYSGGYHAKSYFKCNMTLVIIYLCMIVAVSYTSRNFILPISIILTIMSLCVFLRFAPLDNKNKRMSKHRLEVNRIITLWLIITFYSISMVFYKVNIQIFYTIIVTIFLISMLIILKVKGGDINEEC